METGGTANGNRTRVAGRYREEAAREKLPESVSFVRRSRAGAAREGLLPLWVGVGLGILHELMAAEVDEVCGPKGRHDLKLTATRWSGERGSVTLGERRVPVERPRTRTLDDVRGPAPHLRALRPPRDALTDLIFERIMAGELPRV